MSIAFLSVQGETFVLSGPKRIIVRRAEASPVHQSTRISYLQDVSSEAEETSKASGGADDGAVGGTLESRRGGLWCLGADWDNWGNGGGHGGGAVDVGRGSGLGAVERRYVS